MPRKTAETKPTTWKEANAQAGRKLRRVRHNLQEQQRWELFAAAALASCTESGDEQLMAAWVGKQADAMLEEWRKRWGRPTKP